MGNGSHTSGYGCFAVNLVILLVLALVVGAILYLLGAAFLYVPKGPGVAVLEIQSAIYDEEPILDQIDALLENPDTRALVVHVDSPGGVVATVEEIFNRLTVAAKSGIPVVASMGSVAASGGYFVCLAAERIFANRSTVTGSIGVLIEYYAAGELLNKIGIQAQTITSGEFKGLGSWAQPMTEPQRQHVQSLVNDFHDFFVEVVSGQRHLEVARVRELADGRVFSGRQAIELGLVDELGGLDKAIQYAAERAHLQGKPRVIREDERSVSLLQMFRRYGPPPWGSAKQRLQQRPTGPQAGAAMYLMR